MSNTELREGIKGITVQDRKGNTVDIVPDSAEKIIFPNSDYVPKMGDFVMCSAAFGLSITDRPNYKFYFRCIEIAIIIPKPKLIEKGLKIKKVKREKRKQRRKYKYQWYSSKPILLEYSKINFNLNFCEKIPEISSAQMYDIVHGIKDKDRWFTYRLLKNVVLLVNLADILFLEINMVKKWIFWDLTILLWILLLVR